MPGIGLPELAIVLVILLVIFGPKRLPGLGRSLGSGMREFKESISGNSRDDDDLDGDRAALNAGASSASAEPSAAPAASPTPAPVPAREAEAEPAPSQVPTEPRA